MARIRGLEVHPVMDGVEVWKYGTARMPLERALRDDIVSLDGNVAVYLGRRQRRDRRGKMILPLAKLDLEGFGRIRGAVVARSATRLIRYLLQCGRPTRRTALGFWLDGRALDEASMAELGELLERAWLLGQDTDRTPLQRRLPHGGLALLPDTAELRLARVSLPDHDWWFHRIGPKAVCSVVVDQRLGIAGHRIPQPLHLSCYGPGPWFSWFDGLRSGYCSALTDLPRTLLERFEGQGWMRVRKKPFRPLADLEVQFLLRRPPLSKRPQAPADRLPPGCGRPAILLPSSESVPLVDAERRPLDVPIITDPGEATAVLGRAYNGRIYVPHAHCLDPLDINFHRTRSEWLMGVLPRCLAA